MKILVISDNQAEVPLLRSILTKISLKFEIANKPYLTGAVFLSFQPDIVIISNNSVGFNSMEAIKAIKLKRPNIKVLLISSDLKAGDEGQFIDGVIGSPIIPTFVVEAISSVSSLSREELLLKLSKKLYVDESKTPQNSTYVTGNYRTLGAEPVISRDPQHHFEENYKYKNTNSESFQFSTVKKNKYSEIIDKLDKLDLKAHFNPNKIKIVKQNLKKQLKTVSSSKLLEEKKRFTKALFSEED